jgi:hypothetical protein
MILIFLSPLILIFAVFLFGRLFVLFKVQKERVCNNCLSADTERISRGAWVKKYLQLDYLQKIWCRKCGRIFFV